MKSLAQTVREGLDKREKCKILLSLILWVEDGRGLYGGPGDIFLDERRQIVGVECRCGEEGLFYQPPETLRDILDGTPPTRGKEQGWFTAGMLGYWLFYEENYYIRNDLSFLETMLSGSKMTCVIRHSACGELSDTFYLLTAWDPAERRNGVSHFIVYLRSHYPDMWRTEEQSPGGPGGPGGPADTIVRTSPPTPEELTAMTRWLYVSKSLRGGSAAGRDEEVALLGLNEQNESCTLQVSSRSLPCTFRVVRIGMDRNVKELEHFEIPHLQGNVAASCTLSVEYRTSENCVYWALQAGQNSRQRRRVRLS